MGAAIAAAACGLLLWASSPAVGIGWLAWVAIVPVAAFVLARPGDRRSRVAVPLAIGIYLELLIVPALPFGLAEGQWGDAAVPVLVEGTPVFAAALLGIPLLAACLYLLRFGLPWLAGERLLATGAAIVTPALAWTALDLVRAKFDPGGLWGPLFLSQADLPTAHLAGLAGPWLVTFALVAVNYALAMSIVRRTWRPAALAVAALAVAALVGVATSPGGVEKPAVRVAAVQPGYDTAEEDRRVLRHWEPGSHARAARDVIRDLAPLTARAAASGAQVVVWPEAATYVDPREAPAVRRLLRRTAREAGAAIVVPFHHYQSGLSAVLSVASRPGASGRERVRLSAASPKQRPMWFLGEGSEEAAPRPLPAGGIEVGAMLGVDSQDPGSARELAASGASLLSASTHDWEELARQHRAFERLSTAATGLPLVRADWRYASAVYDADGAELASAGEELRRTIVVARVGLGSPTPYVRIGDGFGWVALAAAGAALFVAGVRRLRSAASGRRGGTAVRVPSDGHRPASRVTRTRGGRRAARSGLR
jgi:apolipoprotein N-acyltransferase